MNIGLDMMGGDFAPLEAVKSIQPYISGAISPANLFLIGDEPQLELLLAELNVPREGITIVHAPQVIGMHEHPTKALREKQQSSIAIGFGLLASGTIDAFISAGNTGAMLVGCHYSIKTLPGVLRPTISSILPKDNGKAGLILDVGLNADCKPEQLNQFAMLGSLYSRYILNTENPRVALLNIGEEEGKGNLLAQATYPLLKNNKLVNFIGNIEGRDVFLDKADVMVCDGFTGNVVLKLAESIYDITRQKGLEHEFLDRFNFENYGGTPILGVSKPVIIGHGISHSLAFTNMIILAHKMLEMDLINHMKEQFLSV
jgi:glycerol-3-phosphate acyltransferase PlsX